MSFSCTPHPYLRYITIVIWLRRILQIIVESKRRGLGSECRGTQEWEEEIGERDRVQRQLARRHCSRAHKGWPEVRPNRSALTRVINVSGVGGRVSVAKCRPKTIAHKRVKQEGVSKRRIESGRCGELRRSIPRNSANPRQLPSTFAHRSFGVVFGGASIWT